MLENEVTLNSGSEDNEMDNCVTKAKRVDGQKWE